LRPTWAFSTGERVKELEKVLKLYVDLNTALRATLLEGREKVCDVVPRMSVEASAQPLLVEVVGNQTHATSEDEETVQNTHLHVVLSLLSGESTAVAHEIHEANSNATVDVEDEVVLLGGGDSLDGDGVVEQLGAREVLLDVLLDEFDTEIRVVAGLDTVTDTGNWNSRLASINLKCFEEEKTY
jgi:hypothetical protein